MLVTGKLPFQEANDSETLSKILDVKYNAPEGVSTDCSELLARIIRR